MHTRNQANLNNKYHPEIISPFFSCTCRTQWNLDIISRVIIENPKIGKRILVPLIQSDYWGLWSSVIIAKALNCALGWVKN